MRHTFEEDALYREPCDGGDHTERGAGISQRTKSGDRHGENGGDAKHRPPCHCIGAPTASKKTLVSTACVRKEAGRPPRSVAPPRCLREGLSRARKRHQARSAEPRERRRWRPPAPRQPPGRATISGRPGVRVYSRPGRCSGTDTGQPGPPETSHGLDHEERRDRLGRERRSRKNAVDQHRCAPPQHHVQHQWRREPQ